MKRLLITGSTGYIGGEILYQLKEANLPDLVIHAVYRNPEHAKHIEAWGFKAVKLDLGDAEAVEAYIVEQSIDIVIELTTAISDRIALPAIRGLARVNGLKVYIGVSGAKIFSHFAGFDTRSALSDDSDDLITSLEGRKTVIPMLSKAHQAICSTVKLARELNVQAPVFVPPMVYGPSRTFGNPISIQIVHLTRGIQTLGRSFTIPHPSDPDQPQRWALLHIEDCGSAYLTLLQRALGGERLDTGMYFAENGTFAWDDMGLEIARTIGCRESLEEATEDEVKRLGEVIGCAVEAVPVQIAGRANIKGNRLRKLGWKPKFDEAHLLADLNRETRYIVKHLENSK